MSEYWGIPLLPFFSCAPAEKVPRFVFDFLAPSVRHFDGVAEKAPYGLRKLESSLLRKYGADEVVVAHPDHVSKFVDDKTSIIGISTMDPMGLGPVSMMFTDGGKLTAYTKRKFLELVGEINRTRKKYPKAKLVLGGSGGWQMEVRDRDTKALGVDHVVIGECDHVIGDIYNDIESNNSPEFIHVPRGPKLEDIPDIQAPSTHGLVEVMRGCGRNCQFC
ncbi:MAG TPA: radical SAM protein, partial [Candidatus Bathyarchaeia archaeon]